MENTEIRRRHTQATGTYTHTHRIDVDRERVGKINLHTYTHK